MQAELDRIRPVPRREAIDPEQLRKDREAVAACGGIVPKTAAKVASDEHTWGLFVEEQGIQISDDAYPTIEMMVEFAAWQTRQRERVCLAQRAEAGARLTRCTVHIFCT